MNFRQVSASLGKTSYRPPMQPKLILGVHGDKTSGQVGQEQPTVAA